MPNEKETFESGAERQARDTHYESISPVGLRRLAETHREGDGKYGRFNWERGIPTINLLSHTVGHIYAYLEGKRDEDHLAHAAWGLFAAMDNEENRPEMMAMLRGVEVYGKPGHQVAAERMAGADAARKFEEWQKNRYNLVDLTEQAKEAAANQPWGEMAKKIAALQVVDVQLKRISPRAAVPKRQRPGDAGFDLYASEDMWIPQYKSVNVPTGWSIKVADGFWASIKPRSSTLNKTGLIVLEGTIDSGYTGPLYSVVYNPGPNPVAVSVGDRLSQLVVIKNHEVTMRVVDELPETSRGKQGFGSTGRGLHDQETKEPFYTKPPRKD